MKTFFFVLILIIFLSGCMPVRYINTEKKYNLYQKYRLNTYTIPIWVPNVGIVLETRIYKSPKKNKPRHRKN